MLNGTNQQGTVAEDTHVSDQVLDADVSTQEPQQPAPEFVSKAELASILDKYKRDMQSLIDKTAGRMDKTVAAAVKHVDDQIAASKAVGITYTPAQEAQLKQNAINNALMAPAAQPNGKTQQQGQVEESDEEEVPQGVSPVTAAANLMMQKAGIMFQRNDPELKLIDTQADDPMDYLNSVQAAIKAYQKRMNNTPITKAGALGAHGRGGAGETLESLTEQLDQMLNHPKKDDLPKIKAIKDKISALTPK